MNTTDQQLYRITHGRIAACCTVTRLADGATFDCIYLRDGMVGVGVSGDESAQLARFAALPLKVRAAVNKQFGQVFFLPIERREDWVRSQVPFTVRGD